MPRAPRRHLSKAPVIESAIRSRAAMHYPPTQPRMRLMPLALGICNGPETLAGSSRCGEPPGGCARVRGTSNESTGPAAADAESDALPAAEPCVSPDLWGTWPGPRRTVAERSETLAAWAPGAEAEGRCGGPGHCLFRDAPRRWRTEGEMGETLNLIDALGLGRDFVFGVALVWIIINLNILKVCAREDREAAQKESAKNQAEHAELTAEIHELKADVKVLLDRSNRPGPDDSAD